MKETKVQRNNKGITLIALVVTIIVLLILAGVSIQMLTGQTGILTQARQARENTRGGEVKDAVALAVAENELAKNTGNGTVRTKEDVVKELVQDGKLTEQEAETLKESDQLTIGSIDIDFSGLEGETTGGTPGNPDPDTGIFTENSTIDGKTGSYNNPTIPAGFKPVNPDYDPSVGQANWGDGKNAPTEEAVNAGLVIEDKDKNQFVWVPVPNAKAEEIVTTTNTGTIELGGYNSKTTPMAEKDEEGHYRGVLYELWYVSAKTVKYKQYSTSNYREPDVVTEYDGTDSDPIKLTKETLQDDYDKMVGSVYKYGGFYVARYEMSLSSDGKAQYKKGEISTNASVIENKWYGFYEKQKEFATKYREVNSTIKSSMIWGSQYDAMMNWMARCNINVASSSIEGKSKNTTRKTGLGNDGTDTSKDIINNIYDLLGNSYEWTLEADRTSYRTFRGGNYSVDDSPSSRRNDTNPTYTYDRLGSRASLYL